MPKRAVAGPPNGLIRYPASQILWCLQWFTGHTDPISRSQPVRTWRRLRTQRRRQWARLRRRCAAQLAPPCTTCASRSASAAATPRALLLLVACACAQGKPAVGALQSEAGKWKMLVVQDGALAPAPAASPKANGRQQHALLHLPHPHRFEGGRAQAVEKVSRLMISGFY